MKLLETKKYLSFDKDRTELKKILEDQNPDEELKKMADIELNELIEINKNEKKLKLYLLPKDETIKKMPLLNERYWRVRSKFICW